MAYHYTMQRMLQLFGSTATRSTVISAEKSRLIPESQRVQTGSLAKRVWSIDALPTLGARYGFLPPPSKALCVAVYSAKGGVFKTSLALNLARMAALHNIKTCVIGLDFQCDVTRLLGNFSDDETDIKAAITRAQSTKGLLEFFSGEPSESVIQHCDIPTLDFIPETAGLITLERTIGAQDRREYKLKEFVVEPLRSKYDLIILDCPPSWSHLITNAIVACDLLLSPLECKISQFNSLPVFLDHIRAFQNLMHLDHKHVYVPTRYTPSRRLSAEIRNWYISNLERVSMGVIRESAIGEEAIGDHVSLPEHSPSSPFADEMRELLREIWTIAVPVASAERAAS